MKSPNFKASSGVENLPKNTFGKKADNSELYYFGYLPK